MASHRTPKLLDQESQLKEIRRQLSDQLGCLEFRMDSKLSLLAEFQEFFKRRGEVEYEYARSLERLCEKFERNTKQRNLRNELRSTFNLWSTMLAETRKMSRERASLAEVVASEMVARLEVMVKDVHTLTKKCKELCVEIQDQYLKELRDLSEQTKVYQHSCYNTSEAYKKVCKSKEKVDAIKGASARRKKAEEKCKEKQKQFKIQKHLLLKNRNDYLLGITRCNSLSTQYFSTDIRDIIENMDTDYHNSFQRLIMAYRDAEREGCEAVRNSGETLVEQTKTLNIENDLNYFMSEYSGPFTAVNYFQFTSFEGDDVSAFKVNTEDVFKRWSKTMADLKEEIQTLQIQKEEDVKTIQHIKDVNLKRYQIVSVEDALGVIEDNGDSLGLDSSKERGNASLERGLSVSNRGGQAILLSQKGKRDTTNFTLQILQRRILRADRLSVANAQLEVLEKAFSDQKVPPVPVGVDSQGRTIPGEVPQLFGGEIVKYIMATGCEIPLIVESCVKAIEKYGMKCEGLFRVPGPSAVLEELRIAFEEGRDPLINYCQGQFDMAAVASTLKAYFRELSIPLFPTDKYKDFIACTRMEDVSMRLDTLVSVIHSLPSQVIRVMRFLFHFLYSVSLHSLENKMNSANLALVFGPTLTRSPDSLDPRQLHNDVPSVNILIQMCIDGYDYIFGDDGASTPMSSPLPPPHQTEDNIPLSTSPPAEPPSAPPSSAPPPSAILESPAVSPENAIKQDEAEEEEEEEEKEEVCNLPPPPCPPRASMEIEITPDGVSPPPRPPKPEAMPPPPPPPIEEDTSQRELTSPTTEQHVDEGNSGAVDDVVESGRDFESSNTSQGSGLDLSSLDAKMQEIEDSILEMDDPTSVAMPTQDEIKKEEEDKEEGDETDSDSEDEDEGEDGLRIGARALYAYDARSDKELSFSRGDALQVITKTPDNNWWDGFHQGRRGFIPVAYAEITELKTSPSPMEMATTTSAPPPSSSSSALTVPAPPQRKSSMPLSSESDSPDRICESPGEPTITEESESELSKTTPVPDHSPDSNLDDLKEESGDPDVTTTTTSTTTTTTTATATITEEEEVPAEVVKRANFPVKSVKSLTKQFQDPSTTTNTVLSPQHKTSLVESTHRRMGSDHNNITLDPKETLTTPPRSASSGSKVSMISSTFENKAAPPTTTTHPPPPTRPKPPAQTTPLSPRSSEPVGFPLTQHGAAGAGLSPLQLAMHQGQHQQLGQKPAIFGKKPAPPQVGKVAGKGKGSIKVKKKDSIKKQEKPSKPPPNPKPATGFVAPADIQKEFQARVAKRKQSEDKI